MDKESDVKGTPWEHDSGYLAEEKTEYVASPFYLVSGFTLFSFIVFTFIGRG